MEERKEDLQDDVIKEEAQDAEEQTETDAKENGVTEEKTAEENLFRC